MQNKKNNYIDVTKDWISNANPNSHEIIGLSIIKRGKLMVRTFYLIIVKVN